MRSYIVPVAVLTVAAVGPVQAHTMRHHRHPVTAAPLPDSVTLADGKSYKLCKPGMEDDCVEPHQAGLGGGHHPAVHRHPHKTVRHRQG